MIVPFALHPEAVPSRYVDGYRAFEECGHGPVSAKQAMNLFYGEFGPTSRINVVHP